MTVRVAASSARTRSPRRWRVPVAALGAFIAALALFAHGLGAQVGGPKVPKAAKELSRRAAVQRAIDVLVRSGAAGAANSQRLRAIYADSFVDDRGIRPVLAAAEQQRAALTAGGPLGVRVLERTAPVGYRLTRFDAAKATVLVWSLHVAGPDRGRLAPGAWWLTTRLDLVARSGGWQVAKAVAIQGPTPRLIRPQQAGVGRVSDLRLMLSTTQRLHGEP